MKKTKEDIKEQSPEIFEYSKKLKEKLDRNEITLSDIFLNECNELTLLELFKCCLLILTTYAHACKANIHETFKILIGPNEIISKEKLIKLLQTCAKNRSWVDTMIIKLLMDHKNDFKGLYEKAKKFQNDFKDSPAYIFAEVYNKTLQKVGKIPALFKAVPVEFEKFPQNIPDISIEDIERGIELADVILSIELHNTKGVTI